MENASHGIQRSRRLGIGWRIPALMFVPMAFLILPSIARLLFFANGTAATSPTDAAFIRHAGMGKIHIILGLVMILLGPTQFIGSIRKRWPAFHRWSGRVFVLSGFTAAITGFAMNILFPPVGGLLKVAAIFIMSITLFVALIVALRAILRGDVATHKAWMIRAYAVPLAGGATGIFVLPFAIAHGEPSDLELGCGRWAALLITAAIVEFGLLRKRSPGGQPR